MRDDDLNENPMLARVDGDVRETGARPDPSKPFFAVATVVGTGEEKLHGPFRTYEQALKKGQALAELPTVESVEVLQIDTSAPPAARAGRTSALRSRPKRIGTGGLSRVRSMAEEAPEPFEPTRAPTWHPQVGELLVNSAERHEMAKQWMREHRGEFVDPSTGYVDLRAFVEGAANAVGEQHWIDEHDHPVWSWARDIGTGLQKNGDDEWLASLSPEERALVEQGEARAREEAVQRLGGIRGQVARTEAEAARFQREEWEPMIARVAEEERRMGRNASSNATGDPRKLSAVAKTGRLGTPRIDEVYPGHARRLYDSGIMIDWQGPPRGIEDIFMVIIPWHGAHRIIAYKKTLEEAEAAAVEGAREVSGQSLKRYEENARCPVGTEVQTLIFSKDDFTEKQAKAWAKKGGFKYGKVDEKEDTWRLRQADPKEFKKAGFRTIEMDDGVKAVVGCPKGMKANAESAYYEQGRKAAGNAVAKHGARLAGALEKDVIRAARTQADVEIAELVHAGGLSVSEAWAAHREFMRGYIDAVNELSREY